MAGLQLAWSFILLTSITWRTSAFFLWWQNVTRGGIQKLIFWFCLLCCQEAEKKRYKENVVVSVAFLFKRHWYLWRGLKCWKKNYLEIWTEQKKKEKKVKMHIFNLGFWSYVWPWSPINLESFLFRAAILILVPQNLFQNQILISRLFFLFHFLFVVSWSLNKIEERFGLWVKLLLNETVTINEN